MRAKQLRLTRDLRTPLSQSTIVFHGRWQRFSGLAWCLTSGWRRLYMVAKLMPPFVSARIKVVLWKEAYGVVSYWWLLSACRQRGWPAMCIANSEAPISAFMGILHTSACDGSFASPLPFARRSRPCQENVELEAICWIRGQEDEKQKYRHMSQTLKRTHENRGWYYLDANVIELAYCYPSGWAWPACVLMCFLGRLSLLLWDSVNFSGLRKIKKK